MHTASKDDYDLDIRLGVLETTTLLRDPVTVHTTRPTTGGPCCSDFCCAD